MSDFLLFTLTIFSLAGVGAVCFIAGKIYAEEIMDKKPKRRFKHEVFHY